MKNSYRPKSLNQLAFEELKRFFRSCPEVVEFLTSDQVSVLNWYFGGHTPLPRGWADQCDFFEKMKEAIGCGKYHNTRRLQFDFAMKKLRARHRTLVEEFERPDPCIALAFVPWHQRPRS